MPILSHPSAGFRVGRKTTANKKSDIYEWEKLTHVCLLFRLQQTELVQEEGEWKQHVVDTHSRTLTHTDTYSHASLRRQLSSWPIHSSEPLATTDIQVKLITNCSVTWDGRMFPTHPRHMAKTEPIESPVWAGMRRGPAERERLHVEPLFGESLWLWTRATESVFNWLFL